MPFRLLPAAKADIDAIVQRSAESDPELALRQCGEIFHACRILGGDLALGAGRSDIQWGLKLFSIAGHLILYRESPPGTAEIVRFVPGAAQWCELV